MEHIRDFRKCVWKIRNSLRKYSSFLSFHFFFRDLTCLNLFEHQSHLIDYRLVDAISSPWIQGGSSKRMTSLSLISSSSHRSITILIGIFFFLDFLFFCLVVICVWSLTLWLNRTGWYCELSYVMDVMRSAWSCLCWCSYFPFVTHTAADIDWFVLLCGSRFSLWKWVHELIWSIIWVYSSWLFLG